MNNIILTGPKHSGKTTTGKVLASLYNCDFIDLDDQILQRTGKTPRQLFIDAPAVFKQAEAETLADVFRQLENFGSSSKQCVISAGGGIIDNPQAAAMIKESRAVIVCLNISVNLAWERITLNSGFHSAGAELPPFLQTENPRETHRILHERRTDACLRFAHIVIEVEGKSPEEIADEIYRNPITS
jgi:shikimate kinase